MDQADESPHVPHAGEGMAQTATLRIAGMSCGACVRHVTRAIEGMNGVVHVDVDLQTNQAVVEHLPDYGCILAKP